MKFKKLIKESIEDMDKRCPECNTLLNDMGTCPKCDDGEEDYGTEVEEACTKYRVKKYGAYWFGILGPDELLLRDDSGKLILFRTKNKAQKFADEKCDVLTEEMSVREKLKAAYPELNFDTPTVEEQPITEQVVEELSNKEKLKRAFPELNFGDELNEAVGADLLKTLKDAMTVLSKDDKNTWATTVTQVVDVIPDNFADDLFDQIKEKFSNVRLTHADKKKVSDVGNFTDEETGDTVGNILDFVENKEDIDKNPEFTKTLVMVVLGIIAVIEPTPVLEIITGIVSQLPATVVDKVVSVMQSLSAGGIAKSLIGKFFNKNEEAVAEAYSEYDDDYDFDDVEEDRVHAALYGGDLTYCKDCGTKLVRTMWGGYCPECSPEENIDDDM